MALSFRPSFMALLMSGLLAVAPAVQALPDLKRGQAALDAGDRGTAEREFRALAEFGLPDAQIALGDLLVDGPPAQRKVPEAMELYLKAGMRDSRGYARLAHLFATDYTLDPAQMDLIIEKLVKRHDRGERALAGDIGALLLARGSGHNLPEVAVWATRARDWGDVRGNLQLGMLCDVPLARPENPGCALGHYRKAAPYSTEAAGRLVGLLQRHPELGSSAEAASRYKAGFIPAERFAIYRVYFKAVVGVPQVAVAETLLADLFNESTVPVRPSPQLAREMADPESALAPAAMIDPAMYDATDAAVELLNAYARNTGPEARRKYLELLPYLKRVRPLEAALSEANVYIAGSLLPSEPSRAVQALQPWAERSPAAAFLLGDIHRVGYLDEADYESARRHYEFAGRAGMGRAWYALTRMYLGSPALVPDRRRAEAYAEKARAAGYLQVDYLLETIPQMQGAL
jgi:TPR repeat protein